MQEISFRNDILPLKDKLFRLALRITLDRAEAEDVVQDTMIRVWNKRDEWSQFESVEAYCLTVAKNLAIDRSQKKEAQNVELTPEMEEEPDANSPYDQMIHDVCLGGLPVIFPVDRSGIVGNDGETHQGIFDLSFLSTMPGMTVISPMDGAELTEVLDFALEQMDGPVAVRYPRGKAYCCEKEEREPIVYAKAELLYEGKDV